LTIDITILLQEKMLYFQLALVVGCRQGGDKTRDDPKKGKAVLATKTANR
jgi:hypothetical protein